MCYFRGSSLKTVPPACTLTRHCLLFQSVAHFSGSVAHFSRSVALFSRSVALFSECCSLSRSIAYFFKNK